MDPPIATGPFPTATVMESPDVGGDQYEIQHLLDIVDELQKSVDSATADFTSIASPLAMAQMKEEFQSMLASISPVKTRPETDPSSTFTDSEFSWYSPQEWIMNSNSEVIDNHAILHDLHIISERMIAGGYSRECIDAYASVRKSGIDERFKKLLPIEGMSSKNIQKLEWHVQEENIRRWIGAAKICIRVLFPSEKRLSQRIFTCLGADISDACFMETIKDHAVMLFNFVEAISTSRRSPEKLFKMLDLYEVLSELMPDIEAIFESKSGEFIRKQAVGILSSLAEAARNILLEFEKAVFGELTKFPIPGGLVHPMTKYVMDYILDMVEHEQTLSQLIVSNPSSLDCICSSELDFDFSEFEGKVSPLVLHLVWIIVVLKFNLQGKSKHYRHGSSANLFLRNNVHHIVQEIKGSIKLRQMIGDDYQNKLICLAEANYQKSSSNRILDFFRRGGFRRPRKVGSF